MAENTENSKFWVRHITEDGNYKYYNIDGNQISGFIQQYPNAQGLMMDNERNVLPYNLTKINDVQSMNNYSLHGISNDNIIEYDDYEREKIRPNRKAFEAFDNVMEKEGVKPGTPLHTLMLNMIAYESINFAHRDGLGGEDRAKGLAQIIGDTFDDMVTRGENTPITQGYWKVCRDYNGGKAITHDDLKNEKFDEAAIALGLNIMLDKLSSLKRVDNIDFFSDDFDPELIPYIYAKYYNSGDANGNIEEHTKNVRERMNSTQVLYDRGRRYYKNYNTLGKSEEPKIEEPKVEEYMAKPVAEPVTSEPAPAPRPTPTQTSLFGSAVEDIRQAISLGDRFLFQRELFAGNGELMQKTLDEINSLNSLSEAMDYVLDNFEWDKESTAVQLFENVLKRRFS